MVERSIHRNSIQLGICFLFSALILFSCTRNKDVDKYMSYTNEINHIIGENKYNTDLAGKAVLKYTTENKAAIETTIKNLNAYTVKQTEENYRKLMQPVNALKQLLSKPQAVYPDSIRSEIMNVLAENRAVVDEQTAALQEASRYFLKSAFAPAAAVLLIIKQLTADLPVTNFKLAANPDFTSAAQIMYFDNLVLPE